MKRVSAVALVVCGALLTVTANKAWSLYVWYMRGHALNYVRYACSDYEHRSSPIPAQRFWPRSIDEWHDPLTTYPYHIRIPRFIFSDLVYVSDSHEFIACYHHVADDQRVVRGDSSGLITDDQMPLGRAFVAANKIKPF